MTDSDKSRSRLHPEMLVGVSAVVIGVCALGVSLYETSLMREEQRAAVPSAARRGPGAASSDGDEGRLWRAHALDAHHGGREDAWH